MRAVKMDVVIGPGRQLSINLPDDIPKGPAELILLTHDVSGIDQSAKTGDFREWLEEFIQMNPIETPKEILDKRIERLRNDWE